MRHDRPRVPDARRALPARRRGPARSWGGPHSGPRVVGVRNRTGDPLVSSIRPARRGDRLRARGGGRRPPGRDRRDDHPGTLVDEPGAGPSRGVADSPDRADPPLALDPRTVTRRCPPDGELVPSRGPGRPAPALRLDLEVSETSRTRSTTASRSRTGGTFWRSPPIDADASLVALVGGELAGLTMIRVDGPSGRAQNDLCGVRRTHRGKGLAVLLKSQSLRRAAELGATIALTDNDETNAPMLAVNARLGYRPHARRLSWERSLT